MLFYPHPDGGYQLEIEQRERRHLENVLMETIGKKIIGFRLGDDGFDLIFEDGDELEVYFIKGKLGLVLSRRNLVPVENCSLANKIVDDVMSHTSIRDISVEDRPDGCFISIDKNHHEYLKRECDKLVLKESKALLC
jgi:hypothetical protein